MFRSSDAKRLRSFRSVGRAVCLTLRSVDRSSSSCDDSSDEELSLGRSIQTNEDGVYTNGYSSGGDTSETSELESDHELISGPRGRKVRGTTLLKLVNSKHPDLERARNLLQDLSPEDVDQELKAKDSQGNSVIHYACIKALVPWVELIIEYGGDLEVKGFDGKRPIHLAVRDKAKNDNQARDKEHLIKLLSSKEVDFNVKDNRGLTPLETVCKFGGQKVVTQALLEHPNVVVDQPIKQGRIQSTLLNITCHNGQFENALLLLKHGANPLATDCAKNTPLHIIVKKGNVKYALRFLNMCKKMGYDMREILSAKNMFNKTVVYDAIKPGDEALIRFCLDHLSPDDQPDGAHSNDYLLDMTSMQGTNVMHLACKKGHLEVALMLYDMCPKLLDRKNEKGWTPLHNACRENNAILTRELCSILLRQGRDLQLNLEESPSLLKFTALKGACDSLVVLLENVKDPSIKVEFIKWISAEKNLSRVLEEVLGRSSDTSIADFEKSDVEEVERIILQCAAQGKTECLLKFAAWRQQTIFRTDANGNTVMHLIARGGHLETSKAVIKIGDIPFSKQNKTGQTPLHIAIQEGHVQLTELLLKTGLEYEPLIGVKDENGMTPMMYACRKGNLTIVDLLLKHSQDDQDDLKLFDSDKEGLNCLDYAINNTHEMVAVKLLSLEKWRDLMAHSTTEGVTRTTPMRKLIQSMPGVCKFVLDKCVTRLPDDSTTRLADDSTTRLPDDTTTRENCTKIKVDYELLEDWFSEWMDDPSLWGAVVTFESLTTHGYEMMLRTIRQADSESDDRDHVVYSKFKADGKLKDGASINVTDPIYRSQKHPLCLMMKSNESRELLNHPVVRLFFRQKQKATRLFYWIRFFLLLTLLVLLTGHSLVIPPPFYAKTNPEGNNYTWLADGLAKWQNNLNPTAVVLFGKVGAWIIMALNGIYLIEFMLRISHTRGKSRSIRDLLSIFREFCVQVFTLLFVLPGFEDRNYGYGVGFKADWQWQFGAFAVFLAWFNFILFLQTVPFFGIYVLMFLEVLSTLSNFILVVGIFIVPFGVVFCILLVNQPSFHTLGESVAKVLAMLTGEIEYSSVFLNLDYLTEPDTSEDFTSLVFYPVSTHIIYIIFIIFMPILIMNLLTGLAVYDIEVIRKKAKMFKRKLEAKGVLDFQNNMSLFLWKGSVVQHEVIQVWTRISFIRKLVYKVTGYKETNDQLVALLDELVKTGQIEFSKTTDMKIEDMADHISDIVSRLGALSENVLDTKTAIRKQWI